MQRVPVLAPDGSPLMPTKPSRARRWLRDGKAVVVYNDLNIFCIQLVAQPSGRETQDIAVGIDPGKLFSGVGVQSGSSTHFKGHLQLPFKSVKEKLSSRSTLRRSRRGRRIKRNRPFKLRNHRQKRFDNRRQKKIPPSIRANRELELRVVKELIKIFPISHIVYEYVKAKGNKGFSPVMVAQKWMLQRLEELRPTTTQYGWETSIIREHLGLEKNTTDKSAATPETHANDGVALASTHFVKYQKWQLGNSHGRNWFGTAAMTSAPFVVIARPNIYRRQLHFEKPDSKKPNLTQYRKRKGGTVTPFGFRSGDYVRAEKAGRIYLGWVGGFTQTVKSKNISLYDINWTRIGQFTPSKVELLQRATGLLVGSFRLAPQFLPTLKTSG